MLHVLTCMRIIPSPRDLLCLCQRSRWHGDAVWREAHNLLFAPLGDAPLFSWVGWSVVLRTNIDCTRLHTKFINFGAVAFVGAYPQPLSQGGNSRCSCCGTADKCLPVFRFTKSFELLELSTSVVVGLPDERIRFSFVVVLHMLHVLTCMRIIPSPLSCCASVRGADGVVMQFGAFLIICLSLRSGTLRCLHGLGGRLSSELLSTPQDCTPRSSILAL